MTFSAYILAGGQSRRFGSDKARAELNGEPLIVRLARQLKPLASATVVVADRPDKYADLGLTTIADRLPGQGPLGGLETALHHSLEARGPGWILLTSCDMAVIESDWINALTPAGNERHLARAFCEKFWHPFPGVYHTALIPLVQEYLASPKASFQRLLCDPRAGTIALPLPKNWPAISQFNTPNDLKRANLNPET